MRDDTLKRIERATIDLPARWREILEAALLKGEFRGEAERLLQSALNIHENLSPDLKTAESILAGDAYIPMAVSVLLDNGTSPVEIERLLKETASRLHP